MDSRSISGFVGLKNGGATCYMNAVFQQLYMQPGLPEVIGSTSSKVLFLELLSPELQVHLSTICK